MPNEDIDVKNLESLEKYRSYARYIRTAQEASKKPAWWKTYRQYLDAENPDKGIVVIILTPNDKSNVTSCIIIVIIIKTKG